MFSLRLVPMVLLGSTFVLAVYLTLLGSGILGQPALEVKATPAGHQEIAWLMPATSGSNWERLVAAAIHLRTQWAVISPEAPPLQASFENAFPNLTAEVPEFALYFEGREHEKLWFRWYKLSSNLDADAWVTKLTERSVAPLAIIGGDTSDRALTLAEVLKKKAKKWRGPPPLLLLTTATADRYFPPDTKERDLTLDTWPKLLDVYKGRSFRFSFTNSRMARAVIDFVSAHPDVWSHDTQDAGVFAGTIATTNAWSSLAILASKRYINPVFLYTLTWRDDRYSLDLADRFSRVFAERYFDHSEELAHQNRYKDTIPYGIGDYFQPNPREAAAAAFFLPQNRLHRQQNQLLVLPTDTQRARRLLRTLCRMAPRQMTNVVALSGDSINFNNIYRDHDLAWNIVDMPVPLVFFAHRNPVDRSAGFNPYPAFPTEKDQANVDVSSQSGTQDLLLNNDILTASVLALFQKDRLVTDADEFRVHLRSTIWHEGRVARATENANSEQPARLLLFDSDGNRNDGTGEHIIWLRPMIHGGVTMTQASITVWNNDAGVWRLVGTPLDVLYHSPVDPGNFPHGLE